MELVLPVLLLPVFWLLRLVGAMRRHRLASAAVLGILTFGVALLLIGNQPQPGPVDYAQGDAALRALLE